MQGTLRRLIAGSLSGTVIAVLICGGAWVDARADEAVDLFSAIDSATTPRSLLSSITESAPSCAPRTTAHLSCSRRSRIISRPRRFS